MKAIVLLLTLGFGFIFIQSVQARDLTYKVGAGYAQSTIGVKDKTTNAVTLTQLNGLQVTYGVAKDLQAGAYFGFQRNFKTAAVGPFIRYDFQRLISRDATIWKHLNLFTQVAFLTKLGSAQKKGITVQSPYLGFEILPFDQNNFALQTGAGVVFDMVDKTQISFTSGMFGDVGVKYYF